MYDLPIAISLIFVQNKPHVYLHQVQTVSVTLKVALPKFMSSSVCNPLDSNPHHCVIDEYIVYDNM